MDHSDIGFVPKSDNNHEDLGFKPASPDISMGESALRGAAQGASFGFAPAITGALEAAPTAAGALTGQNSLQDILDAYNKSREESKANYDKAQAANPLTYMAGGFAGGLAPALLTGGASEAASGASALENMALQGAKYGALSGAGEAISKGPKDLGDVADSVIQGGAGGAITGAALGKLAGYLPGSKDLESIANERALKATGMGKPQLKSMMANDLKTNSYRSGINPSQEPVDTVQKMGKLLLEKNPFQEEPVVTALATPEVILERTQDLAQKSGSALGDILKQFDSQYSAKNPAVVSKFFNPQDASKEIEDQLLKPLMVNGQIPPISEGVAGTIQKVLDTVNQYGNNPIPFEKAQELKTLITGLTKYEQEGSPANQVLRRAGGIINKTIEGAADDVVQSSGNPKLFDKFKQAKDLYGAAKTAEQASLGKSAANMVNRDFGITDYMSMAEGIAAAGPVGGLIAPIANKAAKTYGNSLMATGAKGMSNSLSTTNKYLTQMPKEQIVSFGQQLAQGSDPLSQKLGNVLMKAGERDDIGRNALMFSLMQNSGYRELLHKYFGNQANEDEHVK